MNFKFSKEVNNGKPAEMPNSRKVQALEAPGISEGSNGRWKRKECGWELGFQGSPHFLLYPSQPSWQETLKRLNQIGLEICAWETLLVMQRIRQKSVYSILRHFLFPSFFPLFGFWKSSSQTFRLPALPQPHPTPPPGRTLNNSSWETGQLERSAYRC